jgi:hypothetical protein
MVEVSVADTGAGISADISAQLFQPFITTKAQGMGVGLSISRTIIEAHGGRIWTEPNPGGGAIFKFTLRAATKEDIGDAFSRLVHVIDDDDAVRDSVHFCCAPPRSTCAPTNPRWHFWTRLRLTIPVAL